MTKSTIARLSKSALEDIRLGPIDLAFLMYLMNSDDINLNDFSVAPVIDRFGMERTWFTTRFNKLIRLGYAKRKQKHDPKTGYKYYLYAVADKPGALDDPRINEQLFTHSKQGLKRIYGTVQTTQPGPRPATQQAEPKEKNATMSYRWHQKPHHTKSMDTATMSQADLVLSNFYAGYGFAMPKTPKEWEEARKPGIKAWAEVTETPLDWQAARLLNKRLIEPINREALEVAWERWTSTSYRKERAIGVIEWYEELCQDMTATPWNKGQKYGKKTQNTKRGRSLQRSDKQHGAASANYNEDDFSTI